MNRNPFIRRKPRVISLRQKGRLARLAVIRRCWWDNAELSGKPLICGICGKPIRNFWELDSDHIQPGKMGGCRNDAEENLQPAHKKCNIEKGSQRKPVGKACPRRMGKSMMTLKQAEKYWTGKECICGQESKKSGESLGVICAQKISEPTRHGLLNAQGGAWCEFFLAAELEILKWRPAE